MRDLVYNAMYFAVAAHESAGQKRKYTNVPYYVHPMEVARIVSEYDTSEHVRAAAYLHDVVEDTEVRSRTIQHFFGDRVSALVDRVTDDWILGSSAHENRKTRKRLINKHYRYTTSTPVLLLKMADVLSNMRTWKQMYKHDEKFAVLYLRENIELMAEIRRNDLWYMLEDKLKPLHERVIDQITKNIEIWGEPNEIES